MGNPAQLDVTPTPEIVGNVFVNQYYMVLAKNPSLVYRFYQDISKLGRPLKDGGMSVTTGTLADINKKIQSFKYEDYSVEITSVDSQESHNGGVIVLVIGYLIASNSTRQKFTQSFFLAPQDKGYFVLNDVFRFVDDDKHENIDVETNTQIPSRQDSLVVEDHNSVQSNDTHEEEPYPPSDPIEQIIPAADVSPDSFVADVSDDGNSKAEEVSKMSYASILKVAKDVAPSKPIPKSPEKEEEPTMEEPVPPSDSIVSSISSHENSNYEDNEGESTSIYIKGLPLDASIFLVENECSKFGPIKPNGVQVIHQPKFCYGFVEFEGAQSMQAALEASPIMMNGFRVIVEEKKSTSRGNNNRVRYLNGNGSYYRGRGNFNGGRFYNRNDFANRRGGYPTRGGGEVYRRNDRMGSNGNGRPIRGNGLVMNGSGRSMTTVPSLSAAA